MKVKITYPPVKKHKFQRRKFLSIVKWPMIIAAFVCPLANIILGGTAWSSVVVMGLWIIWDLVLCPDLVEYNRISQVVKVIVYSCILLTLVELFISSGWAIDVVPIVCFGGLVVSGVLFFSDIRKQKHNMMPMLYLIFLGIIGSAVGLAVWHETRYWQLIVMGVVAVCLLIACIATLGKDFIRELKRRLHTK